MRAKDFRPGPVPDPFDTEETPVAFAVINDIGGVVSKSAAKQRCRYEGNKALWDGAPSLAHPTHNRIYSPSGVMPDVAAQSLNDAGLIADPYTDTMWEALQRESTYAMRRVYQLRAESIELQRMNAEIERVAGKIKEKP